MENSFQKEIVDETNYSKYLEELKNYYTLKSKYTSNKQIYINKLVNSNDTLETKKKLYSKKKFKCVNCGNDGGTIFFENNKILRATCGNTTNPCNLNIEIVKMNSIFIHKELNNIIISIADKKKQIILTKLDFLFNYIPEDKAVELFENFKNELSIIQENYNNLFSLYNSIAYNTETQNLIDEKILEHTTIVDDYKQFIKLYKDTNENKYLKDAVNLYISKLKDLNEFILNTKYKYNNIEFNDDYKILIQNKYNLTDLELIKKPK